MVCGPRTRWECPDVGLDGLAVRAGPPSRPREATRPRAQRGVGIRVAGLVALRRAGLADRPARPSLGHPQRRLSGARQHSKAPPCSIGGRRGNHNTRHERGGRSPPSPRIWAATARPSAVRAIGHRMRDSAAGGRGSVPCVRAVCGPPGSRMIAHVAATALDDEVVALGYRRRYPTLPGSCGSTGCGRRASPARR